MREWGAEKFHLIMLEQNDQMPAKNHQNLESFKPCPLARENCSYEVYTMKFLSLFNSSLDQ